MDTRMVRAHKIICPTCKGNGYLTKTVGLEPAIEQCSDCNSQGEIMVEEPTVSQCEEYQNDQ